MGNDRSRSRMVELAVEERGDVPRHAGAVDRLSGCEPPAREVPNHVLLKPG